MSSASGVEERLRTARQRAERAEAEANATLEWAAWAELERERATAERDVARAERDMWQRAQLAALAALDEFQSSLSWRMTAPVRDFALRHPRLYRLLLRLRKAAPPTSAEGLPAAPSAAPPAIAEAVPPSAMFPSAVREDFPESLAAPRMASLPPRTESVDIIICVHNALEAFENCIESVVRNTHPPFRVIVVDDGSGVETATLIDRVAAEHGFKLVRNPAALGYTRAANIGLGASDAPWIVLLNSDTVVTSGWLDRMWAHTVHRPDLGVIGPLSNTASWQSVPTLFTDRDWAQNPLPPGLDPDDMAATVARVARGALSLPFLNGFCYMIRRAVMDQIGPFDEAIFGAGYGEENDFSIRARNAGWTLIVATDAYVYHAQSKSYSNDRRLRLARAGDAALERKHDPTLHIIPQVGYCRDNLPMHSVRARVGSEMRRRDLIEEGCARWAGKRIAFIVPEKQRYGSLQESAVLQRMGVDVDILTFDSASGAEPMKTNFRSAPDHYDAIVATSHESVNWFSSDSDSKCRLAYYVQDTEDAALDSYTYSPEIKLLARSSWIQREVLARTGQYAALLGPSLDAVSYAPAEARALAGANAPVRISAMLEPTSPRAGSARTIAVLEKIILQANADICVDVFGASDAELVEHGLSRSWIVNRGELEQEDVARLLGVSHIFADLSDYQPEGLITLAAMMSGCVVIGPRRGALGEFVRHGQNGILIDTVDEQACVAGLATLIENAPMRTPLQINAIHDAHRFVPERAVIHMLRGIFS